jgi:hypothetical protein
MKGEIMKGFELQFWHVVVFFITIFTGIFKNEITSTIYSCTTIWGTTYFIGQKIQIQSVSGEWKEVTILNYKHEIPFIKTGGVLVRYDDGNNYEETIHFVNWKTLRIRRDVSTN